MENGVGFSGEGVVVRVGVGVAGGVCGFVTGGNGSRVGVDCGIQPVSENAASTVTVADEASLIRFLT